MLSRQWLCQVLFLLRLHKPNCERCRLWQLQQCRGIDMRERLEQLRRL